MDLGRNILRRNAMILVLVTALVLMSGCGGKQSAPEKSEYGKQLSGICDYIDETMEGWYRAGESGSDWCVILYSKDGRDFDYDGYLEEMGRYITKKYAEDGRLDPVKATEWHHAALAVKACGGDPTNIGEDKNGDPVNLIADGIYDWKVTDDLASQGSNALIYALITLDECEAEVPEGSKYTRAKIVDKLLKYQTKDGGFSLDEHGKGSTDITAMAVQALAPYYEKNVRVQESVDTALAFLSGEQQDSGMYLYGDGYSSETISQVIMALCALGRDPEEDEEFIKSGGSLVDALMAFRMDNGSFSHEFPDDTSAEGDNLMSSQQAGQAFAALVELEKEQKDE